MDHHKHLAEDKRWKDRISMGSHDGLADGHDSDLGLLDNVDYHLLSYY